MNAPSKATEYVAFALLLICADLQSGYAQTAAGSNVPTRSTVQGDRNLLVQAASASVSTPGANQTQRVALVIGNAAYKDAPLSNPVNDARAFAQALQESGFSVILRENTDQRGMLAALREFGDRLRAGGTGLFYYAGHGMQIKGRNYLIPIGANVEREDEIAYSTVDAQAVLDKMEAAGNPANIMILDACRNNPFIRSSRNGQTGLSQMDAPAGTLVAFSTAPGAVASDGTGSNGLYTQHLLNAVRQSGSKVEDVFKQVRSNVRRESQGKQTPWEVTSLEGEFYFKPPVTPAQITKQEVDSSSHAAANATVETALWEAVKNSTLTVEIRAYLGRYPTGRYAAAARNRLAQLQPGLVEPAVVAAAQQPATVAPIGPIPSPTPQPAVMTTSNRPAPTTNSFGVSTGDVWRYQSVDKFKQEVVLNWSRRVDGFSQDGTIKLSGGYASWTADGFISRLQSKEGYLREYSPLFKWRPDKLETGYSEPVKFDLVWKNADGENGSEERTGTLKVISRESVKVPAGEFESWKIQMSGFANGKNVSRNTTYVHGFKETFWYVPALRNFVANEYEQRTQRGELVTFSRNEMTSYSVRVAQNLAQR